MPNDALFGSFAGIMAMALATYATRIAGFWLMGHVPMTIRVRRVLETLPGAIVVATIVPLMVRAGVSGSLGIGMTLATMMLWRNEFLAVAIGLTTVALMRLVGF